MTEQGIKVQRESQRLKITDYKGKIIREVRLAALEALWVFGRISLTPPAIHALLRRNIPVFFFSLSGKLLGKLSSPMGKNIELRILQFEKFEDKDFKLSIASRIVVGKIRNQRKLLVRHKANADLLSPYLEKAAKAQSIEELMGIEGTASKIYFGELGKLFSKAGFSFQGRSRRPPKDPVNALLSLGYTLLLGRIWGVVEAAGFDPYLGFLHTPDYGKPALALDLMEEWRAPLVDALVLRLVNWKTLKKADFTTDPDDEDEDAGVRLTSAGLKKFLNAFSEKLREEVTYQPMGKTLKYSDVLKEQVYLLAREIKGDAKYKPFEMK